jgi:hypothetical protein
MFLFSSNSISWRSICSWQLIQKAVHGTATMRLDEMSSSQLRQIPQVPSFALTALGADAHRLPAGASGCGSRTCCNHFCRADDSRSHDHVGIQQQHSKRRGQVRFVRPRLGVRKNGYKGFIHH